jgi:hypothetical protein
MCYEWIELNASNFHANKTSPDLFNTYCKICTSKKAQKNRKDNIEIRRQYDHDHYKTNIKRKEANKQWYEDNKEHASENYKKWQQTEEGKATMQKHNRNRNETKKHDISIKEWGKCKDYFNFECAYCGMTDEIHRKLYKQQLHREHAYPSGANDLSNCIPSCRICNSEKHEDDWDEWYNNKNQVFNEHRFKLIKTWLEQDYIKYIKINKDNEIHVS